MVRYFGFHAVDDADVIDAAADILKDLTDVNAAFAIALERKGAGKQGSCLSLGLDSTARNWLTRILG